LDIQLGEDSDRYEIMLCYAWRSMYYTDPHTYHNMNDVDECLCQEHGPTIQFTNLFSTE